MSPWMEAARPKTLPAAAAPVAMASALAWQSGSFKPAPAALCLSFALLMQVGANFANDYFDFKNGADTMDRIGPRRAVASGLIAPENMKRAAAAAIGCAMIVGCGLIPWGGWPLIFAGVACALAAVGYTGGPLPYGYRGLGEVFVMLFFGLAAVALTFYVQTGSVSAASLYAAVAAGALATNLLVVNNCRDAPLDARAGKMTLAARHGRKFARREFDFFGALALASFCALSLDMGCLWAALPRSLAPIHMIARDLLKHADSAESYQKALEAASAMLVGAALLFVLGLALCGQTPMLEAVSAH